MLAVEEEVAAWPGAVDRAGTLRLVGAGIDTLKWGWYIDPNGPESDWLYGQSGRTAKTGEGGGWVLSDKVLQDERPASGYRVGLASKGLLWMEGHPAPGGLAKAAELPTEYERAKRALNDMLSIGGLSLPEGRTGYDLSRSTRKGQAGWVGHRRVGEAGLARLDITADFETPTQTYGLDYMRAFGHVAKARGCVVLRYRDGQTETLELKSPNGRKTLARIYDKGVESGAAPPGRLLRFEDQRRFDVGKRRALDAITAEFLADRWTRRYGPYAEVGREYGGALVASAKERCMKVRKLRQAGVITAEKANRMMGNIMDESLGGGRRDIPRATLYRWRAELREFGLLGDSDGGEGGSSDDVQIALFEPFDLAKRAEIWD